MSSRWWLLAITLVAAFFRFHLLAADVRFHPDEALFASFARNAAVRGEWLLPGNLDKTPFSIYLQAVAMLLFGIQWDGSVWRLDPIQGEFAARMASVYASVLLIPVTFNIAKHLTTPKRAMFAALLVALSPYGIAFGATVFTDAPMVLFVMLAVWMALRGQSIWTGVWLILGYASKQQALFFLPLAATLLLLVHRSNRLYPVLQFLIAIAMGYAALAAWDTVRPYPSILLLATQNNAPEQWLVAPVDVIPRLGMWLSLAGWMFGGWFVTFPLLAWAVYQRTGKFWVDRFQTVLLLFVIGYALLHWLIPLNIYDRYVLPVVPVCAVLIASWLPLRKIVVAGVVLLMLPSAWQAATTQIPIGGDKGDHDGMIELADYLNEREFGAIVYDRWLGWELNYYLGAWSDKRRAYYPTPQAMTADPALYVADVAPRYLPAPRSADADEWLQLLEQAGFTHCVGYTSDNFVVYVMIQTASWQPDNPPCLP